MNEIKEVGFRRVTLRLPPDIHDWLLSHSSMNATAIGVFRERMEDSVSVADVRQEVAEIHEIVVDIRDRIGG